MGQIPVSVAKKKVNKHFAGQNNYHGKMRQLKRFFFSPLPLLVVTGGRVWDLFSHMLLLSNFYWIQGSLCCHGCIEGCKCGGTETCLFESISTLGVQNSVLKTLPILPVWFCTNKIRDPRGATFNYPGEVSQMMSHTRHRPNCCVFFFCGLGGVHTRLVVLFRWIGILVGNIVFSEPGWWNILLHPRDPHISFENREPKKWYPNWIKLLDFLLRDKPKRVWYI